MKKYLNFLLLPLLMGLLLSACKLSISSFVAPDKTETGTVITLNLSGYAEDIEDGAKEHGVILQIPQNWQVISAKAQADSYIYTLSEQPAYEPLYTAEPGYKVWVGTSFSSHSGDQTVTATIKVLTGDFDGSVGDTKTYTLKAAAGVKRDNTWVTDDPEGEFNFSNITEEKYVESIIVTKVEEDNDPPDPVSTLKAESFVSGSDIRLDWSGYDENAPGDVVEYRIYQSTSYFDNVSGMIPIDTVPAGTFTYQVSDLTEGVEYFFAVTAVDEVPNENKSVTPVSIVPTAGFCVSTSDGLQSALTTAASNGQDDVIGIVQGTYSGNFVYDSNEAYDLTIQGGYIAGCSSRVVDPNNTVLDGEAEHIREAGTVLSLTCSETADFIVDGLTLREGKAGIDVSTLGSATLRSNIISDNKRFLTTVPVGKKYGGAYISAEHIHLADNIISGNESEDDPSSPGGAGGLDIIDAVTVNIINNVIAGNNGESAYKPGGFRIYAVTVTLSNNLINANRGDFEGGGLIVSNTTTLANNVITDNSSYLAKYLEGNWVPCCCGGISVNASLVILDSNTITNNSAGAFGGIGIFGETGILTNNIIAKNHADYLWGGGYFDVSSLTLTNNTVTCNEGTGVSLLLRDDEDTADFYNNITWNNSMARFTDAADLYIDNDGDDNGISSIVNLFNNDFDQSPHGTYIKIPFPIDPSNLDNVNPSFDDPANNDYHLQEGSPCIDVGTNCAPNIPITDKDGKPRYIDGDNNGTTIVDLGAYEFGYDRCAGDFDSDGDVDGTDLAQLAANPGLLDLAVFAAYFGRTDCPPETP